MPKGDEQVAAVEISDDGRVTGVSDQRGRPLRVSDYVRGPQGFAVGRQVTNTFRKLPAKDEAAVVNATPNAWLDEFVVTPGTAERVEKRLSKYVKTNDAKTGMKRFVRDGDVSAETLVDGAGGIVEERISRGGQLLHRASHTYARHSAGVWVRSGSRVESTVPGKNQPFVVERRFSNIELVAGGGK